MSAAGKLFANNEDFKDCIDRGMKIMMADENMPPPNPADLEAMRALVAIFVTATMQMDPNAHKDAEEFALKISTVRMALLAAYNIGKRSAT